MFMSFLISTIVCYNDTMSEILDLQRDLRAKIVALCEEYTHGTRTLSFFSFCQRERVALRSMLGNSATVP